MQKDAFCAHLISHNYFHKSYHSRFSSDAMDRWIGKGNNTEILSDCLQWNESLDQVQIHLIDKKNPMEVGDIL